MKIAIVKLSALGDIVHAMVVLQLIKKFNHEIAIDWIVDESFSELLKYNPHINKVHIVNIKGAKKKKSILLFLKELNSLRNHDLYDLVIDMQGLIKSAIISKLLPSKQIIGFDKLSVRERLASNFYNKKLNCSYETNVIERNFELSKFALDIPFHAEVVQRKLPFLYSSKCYFFEELSKIKKNVVLIPGASHKSKRYPAKKFAELSESLDANFMVIWGNIEEKSLADEIKLLSPKIAILHKLSIDALISLINQVDLVIGPDTGPTHIAWGLNKPSISLFGATPGYRNAFETKTNKIIESDSEVDPFNINKKDFSISSIDAAHIAQVAKILLNSEIN